MTISLIRLLPTADDDTRAKAASVLWRAVNQERDLDAAFEHYLSFLAIMLPEIQNSIEVCVRDLGHRLAYNEFPTSLIYEEFDDEETIPIYLEQAMVYLGVSLLVPFKNISNENYTGYFSRRIAALSSMVGGDYSKMGMPFSVEKCIHFKSKMNQFEPIRRRIVQFLVSGTVRVEVLMNIVARYVLSMIAWAEMTGFFFVLEALVSSVSPVLLCMELSHETSKFFDIAEHVFSTDHPSLYRYLAPEGQMVSVDKSQFPVLYAVAYNVLAEQHPSIKQLFGPINISLKIVKKYVMLHKNYVNSNMFITSKVDRFIPDLIDPDIKMLALQMRTHNLSVEELMRLKAFSARDYTVAETSNVRYSHTPKNYVMLHKNYVNSNLFIPSKVDRFIPDLIDPDIKMLALHMRTYNLSYEELMRMKAFSARDYTAAETSYVRDSHTPNA